MLACTRAPQAIPLAALVMFGGIVAASHLSACSALTPVEAALLEDADVASCSALTLIPIVGAGLGAACVGEEPAVKAALDHAVTSTTPDAGAPIPQAAIVVAGAKLGAPLTARRRGRRRHVGRCPVGFTPSMVAAAQAHLDARGEP